MKNLPNNIKNQSGGHSQNIPLFSKPKPDYEVKNPEYKKEYKPEYNTQNTKPVGMPPLVNLQVYQPPQKQKPKNFVEDDINKLDASLFMPTYMNNLNMPGQYGLLNSFIQPAAPLAPTILKNYVVNANGPTSIHEKISYIYEDMIPSINIPERIKTLKDKNTFIDYLRSLLFSYGDGNIKNLDERENSLMQYLKYEELNPYNKYKLEQNPYKSLPNNFLIYTSCYPIEKKNGSIVCAKNAISLNIKIYKLDDESFDVHLSKEKKHTDYDQWREIKYYEYIKEYILKKNICPNFVSLVGYYLNDNATINFDFINDLKHETTKKTVQYLLPPFMVSQEPQPVMPQPKDNNNKISKCLIAITESPDYNILEFSSSQYVRNGISKKMIRSGFYNENIWYSLLFQLITALYVLQKNLIYFNNFTIDDNIFITKNNITSNAIFCWKYKINGVDYYVPNHEFIAKIDTNYNNNLLDKTINKRIISPILNDGEDIIKKEELSKLIYENMFKKTFDSHNFTSDLFKNFGGISPPEEILNLMKTIHEDNFSTNIEDYIRKYFGRYLNNRIGSYLKDSEIKYIKKDSIDFKTKGKLIVNEVSADTYIFVMYLKQEDNNTSRVLIIDQELEDKTITEKIVPDSLLYTYSYNIPIEQNFKANENNLDESSILETYVIE